MIKFGTDGWRGIIAKDFTFDNLREVAQATSLYLLSQNTKNPKIMLGYDCRFLSKEFAEEAASVFCANKIKVYLSNTPVPTPANSASPNGAPSALAI